MTAIDHLAAIVAGAAYQAAFDGALIGVGVGFVAGFFVAFVARRWEVRRRPRP